jgi:hypothetical protein
VSIERGASCRRGSLLLAVGAAVGRARPARCSAGSLLLGGRVADLFGRRRIFMVGLVVFGRAAPFACGLELDGNARRCAPFRVSVRRSSRGGLSRS